VSENTVLTNAGRGYTVIAVFLAWRRVGDVDGEATAAAWHGTDAQLVTALMTKVLDDE
jgi:SH3-like domain-containing protein